MTSQGSHPPDLVDRAFKSADYIRLEREKIARQQTIVRGVEFCLTPELLDRLHRARARGERLPVPTSLLTDLHDYVFSGDAIAFTTSYREGDLQETVLRSSIAPNGEIDCQIRNDYLADAPLLFALSHCHHWSIGQILRGLHRRQGRPQRRRSWLSWVLALFIVGAIILWRWSSFPASDPVSWMIVLLAVWLLQSAIAWLLPRLRRRG